MGFYETLVEYYTGLDASQLTDEALALKVAHILKIRRMEFENNTVETLSKIIDG